MGRVYFLFLSFFVWEQATTQTISRYSVVIDELLPDPSPVIGLPGSEFIELRNTTNFPINLRNWKIGDGSSMATLSEEYMLQPDSMVIICSNSSIDSYTPFGAVIGVSNFPSLNNDADRVTLYASNGMMIHTVAYNQTWFQNEVKAGGGWSLEMIDTRNPCTGAGNWKASQANMGGTPGKINSVDGSNKDEIPPALMRTFTLDSLRIVAVLDEPLDISAASVVANYQLDNGVGKPLRAQPLSPLFNEVMLVFSSALSPNTVYQLTIRNVQDCAGNTIGMMNEAKAGLPQAADTMQVVLNEILFNPSPDGFDYIELYNRGNRILDLKQWFLANRNTSGTLVNINPVSETPWLLFPQEWLVLTENKQWLQQHYLVKQPQQVLEMPSLPSMPDDKGSLVLTDSRGLVIDELNYDEQWHFALVNNKEGIALERIDPYQPTQNKSNWTSAASTAGFGTPGYLNSQTRAAQSLPGSISISSKVFSPDNDGWEDYTLIHYQMPEPGFVAHITIFDAVGRQVRSLVKSATLGQSGYFRWDGLDDQQRRLPIGIYIVLAEVFNAAGKTGKYKQTVTLARKF